MLISCLQTQFHSVLWWGDPAASIQRERKIRTYQAPRMVEEWPKLDPVCRNIHSIHVTRFASQYHAPTFTYAFSGATTNPRWISFAQRHYSVVLCFSLLRDPPCHLTPNPCKAPSSDSVHDSEERETCCAACSIVGVFEALCLHYVCRRTVLNISSAVLRVTCVPKVI